MKSLDFIHSLLFSSLFGVLAFNSLLIYAVLKKKVFVHYFLLVVGLAAHMSLFILSEKYPVLVDHLSIITALACVVGAILFTCSFIGIEKGNYPKWWKILRVVFWGALSIMVLQTLNIILILNDEISFVFSLIAASLALSSIILSFTVAISLWKKESSSKLFVLVNSPMMLAALIYILAWFTAGDGVGSTVQFSWPIKYGFAGGLVLQMILFSVFIGIKIKNAEREKLALQQDINKKLSEEIQLQTRFMALAKDEMESQRNELKSLNDLKNKLFLLVANDLKNPLQHLLNMVNVLESEIVEEQDKIWIAAQAKEEMSESITIIDRLLSWTQKQLEGISLKKEELALNEVLEGSLIQLSAVAAKKGVTIEKQLDCNKVYFDEEMLKVVLRNLVSNAIKFSYEGGTISITSISDKERVSISVSDEGVGINAQLFESIKADNSIDDIMAQGMEGDGFGLIITKDFVEMNGGTLNSKSELTQGTTFTINVPLT